MEAALDAPEPQQEVEAVEVDIIENPAAALKSKKKSKKAHKEDKVKKAESKEEESAEPAEPAEDGEQDERDKDGAVDLPALEEEEFSAETLASFQASMLTLMFVDNYSLWRV